MKVVVGTEKVTLKDAALLGTGGEARVFRHRDLAIKIFHELDGSLPPPERAMQARDRALKLAKLAAFPRDLPPEIVAPRALVYAPDGQTTIGFAMSVVEGTEVVKLHLPSGRGLLSNADVVALFTRLHGVLAGLHARGICVGDLNDGNVLFQGAQPWVIDADSMQLPGHPCTVAHERFLDPRLYGKDLAAGPTFDAGSDWYAFQVMLFASLLRVHPYGGTHPRYGTLLRRAEAAHSVLCPDVKPPKAAEAPHILPETLLEHFERTFDHGVRGPFPASLLAVRWTRCPKCQLEHARPVCPRCAVSGVLVAREAVRYHGRCRAIRIHRTSGRILAAAVGAKLEYVYEERGVVRREDGARVMEEPAAPGMRFVPAGGTTWIGWRDRLVAVEREVVRATGRTGTTLGEPSFDATGRGVLRLEGDWLVEQSPGPGVRTDSGTGPATLDLAGAARVGQILEGQTWVRSGDRLGFGFYRAGLSTFAFVFRPGRPGLTDVRLPPIRGHLVEVSACFDADALGFCYAVELDGRREVHLFLIGADGAVRAHLAGSPEAHRALASVRGKCLAGGVLVTATDEGLLSLEVDRASGTLVERTLFSDTEPFVELGAELLPGPGGSIYVVTAQEITELVLA